MKKTLIASVLGLAFATSASAADLPVQFNNPAVASGYLPIFTWSGFYLGAQVGPALQRDQLVELDVCVPGCADRANGRAFGVIGGVHGGFNVQLRDVVLGLEGDIEAARLRHTTTYPLSAPDTFSSATLWQASVRGRVGYAFSRLLPYVTGGLAFADIKHTYVEATSGASQSLSGVKIGWTVGGGIEYAFTDHWLARVEYRYSDFGRTTEVASVFARFTENHRETQQAIRVGGSYKF